MNLVGIGQDSHKFLDKKNIKDLILGGVKIESEYGIKANSDGDVILHSICNALSSAVGGDSLGTWADEMCLKLGINDSSKYVEKIMEQIKLKKMIVGNVAIAVEAKVPFIEINIIQNMKEKIANLLELNKERVGITFTSGEGLTAFGRGEGIQVISMVNLISNES